MYRQYDSVDVIVIGSGFAGLAAAIVAAQAGCSVRVLEKRDFCGGNSWISGGALAAVDSAMQDRYGIADSTKLMFEDMMRAGRCNNPELVQLVCEHSYDVLQWLRKDFGVKFMPRLEQLGGHSVPRCHNIEDIQGRNIINPMLEMARDLGVQIHMESVMEALIQCDDGAVIGVELRNPEGAQQLFAQQSVILASGGFSDEAAGANALRTSLNDSTSEILHIAEQAGAELVDMEHLQMLPCASPDEEGRGVAPVFASYVIFPYGLMINPETGQRFVNEWTDRKTRADKMLALSACPIGITDQQALDIVGDMIYDHMDEKVTRRFDSLEALAAFHQLPYDVLKETVTTYNDYVARGCDDDFAKPIPVKAKPLKAPFYSVRLWPKAHSTMGGVRINAQAQVMTPLGNPIPRLYAAGEVTGGVHGMSRLGCCAITECLVFGRIAGEQSSVLNPTAETIS
ncbi:MAG: Flavocytochrome c flavin subunit [uncultured Thiotrichaceae bacterium]|uniref:Flavocytochrome c flavin subunit n=1 Tax=uncultured Thiotrichaceae bacterium TaxID=298394 RepID=A0A6S6SN30_9GAMM|nr:MAG: Flavocytochrome c flavin subunit [uncultured Thiotrichaceae bacterium]